jgi:hypothetical protein
MVNHEENAGSSIPNQSKKRKASLMQKQSLIFVMAILIIATGLFAAEGANFSGTWVLDQSRITDTGDMPRMDAGKIVVKQSGDSLSTDRYLSNPMMGDFTVSEKLTLDGKECKTVEEYGTRLSTAVWSEDHNALTINSTLKMSFDGQDMEMKSVEIWSFEKENILKLDTTRNSPMGEMKDVTYYNKAQ